MPKLIIDDMEIEVPKGTRVIEAAERLGIMIPRFCYHEAMGAIGACRMCAVKFLQGPFKGVQMSCMVDAQDGMVVSTTDPEAVGFRKQVIEWLMINHPHDCPVCDEGGQCLLQDETVSSGHGLRKYDGLKRTYRNQYLGIFLTHEMNRCIHCYRCSRFYQEYAGYRDLGAMQISNKVYFGRFEDGQLESPFSGNLYDICPTGVYTDKPARYKVRRWHLQRAPSLCMHCSLGCNTMGNANYRGVVRIEARPNKAVNGHFLCDPCRFAFAYTNGGHSHDTRPWRPRVMNVEKPWVEVLGAASEKLLEIVREHGPGSVAVLGSTRNSLETQCTLQRFSRERGWREPAFFPGRDIARKSRIAVSRLDERLAVSLSGLQKSDFVLVVGADPINEAPMLAFSLRQAWRERKSSIVVVDPRPVEMPLDFTHIPTAPGDIDECIGAIVKGATCLADAKGQGSEAVKCYKGLPEEVAASPARDLVSEVMPKLEASRFPVIVCGTGITRESTISLVAELALLLRGSKKSCGLFYLLPGAGAFSAALLQGGLDGRSFDDILLEIENGEVKALVCVETDPFFSYHDRERLEAALGKLKTVIAIDYVSSRTVDRADYFLPSSTIFETGSTYVNQEGRVQFARRVHDGGLPIWGGHITRKIRDYIPGGEHKPAWQGFMELAGNVGEPWIGMPEGGLPEIISRESGSFDIFASSEYPVDGQSILPESETIADFTFRKAKQQKQPEGSLELLVTDWLWGTEELAFYSDYIAPVIPEPCLLMNTADAIAAGLIDGERVTLQLDGGELEIKLRVSDKMARGVLVMPAHRDLEWQKMKVPATMLKVGSIRRT